MLGEQTASCPSAEETGQNRVLGEGLCTTEGNHAATPHTPGGAVSFVV